MQPLSFGQTLAEQIYFTLWRCDAFLGFLLKRMQNINRFGKTNSVDRSPCVTPMFRDDFDYRPSTKPAQRFCRGVDFTLLRSVESLPNVAPNFARESAQVSSA